MKAPTVRALAATVVAGTVLACLALPSAQSQIRATPSFLPIGASASGNASTAWFHEPSTGRALACQTVHGPNNSLTGIQCVATRLPAPDTP